MKIENKIELLPLHGNKAKSFFLTGEVERSTIIYSITSQNTMHLITVFKLRIYFICKEKDLLTAHAFTLECLTLSTLNW